MPYKIQLSYIYEPEDLLELYCGSGTFTLPLSYKFNNVFATENNRQSIKCLKKSIDKLSINNINYARLSAEEVSEAFNGRASKQENIHILYLSATPIPRTMNFIFSGLKEFSFLHTPPTNRISIKSFLKVENLQLFKEAISREVSRGGQCFIVQNDISKMEFLKRNISRSFCQTQYQRFLLMNS